VDRQPVECTDLLKWADWYENNEDRSVAVTGVGPYVVSTVFLGLNHNFNFRLEGPPILFETMVFSDGESCGEMDRCSTWAEAEQMHKRMVQRMEAKHNENQRRGTGGPAAGSEAQPPSG
jgi:hypothetical protein